MAVTAKPLTRLMTRDLKPIIGLLTIGLAVELAVAQEAAGGGTPQRQFGGRRPGSPLSATPLAKDDTEKKVLDVLDGMNSRSRGMLSVPRDDGRFLRLMAESTGAKNVVEIGTSHGYSGVWMAMVLQKTGGKLTTFEIDPERAKLAREHFKQAGVDGAVTLVEGDAHKEVGKVKGPVDLVFLDADKEGYLDYLNQLLPLLRPGGLVIAHNIDPGMADPRYVEAVTKNPNLDTVFANFGSGGVSITLKKR